MTSPGTDRAASQLSRRDGAIGRWLADRSNRATLTTVVGAGAIVGAVAGAATAMRSHSDDVISGEVSIDLLKKVELLTIGCDYVDPDMSVGSPGPVFRNVP